jgi:hypothetical protein
MGGAQGAVPGAGTFLLVAIFGSAGSMPASSLDARAFTLVLAIEIEGIFEIEMTVYS